MSNGPFAALARSRGGTRGRKGLRVPLLWAVPAIVLVVAMHYVAVGAGSWYAFTDWDGVSPDAEWIGLDNFTQIFQDSGARGALINTVLISLAFVIVANVIGLALALALHRTLRTRNFLRAVFFAPVVLSSLAVAYIWQFIFEYDGPLNEFLRLIGLESWARPWLADPTWARWTIWVVLVWQFSGLAMALYLAGLQGIPEDVDEAAAIDGASTLFRLRKVTLPLLAPAMTVSITLTTIYGLRVFDQVLGLTGGGPGQASETLATQVYKQTFVAGRFGYGAALALVLTVLVAVVSIAQIVVLRARERRIG